MIRSTSCLKKAGISAFIMLGFSCYVYTVQSKPVFGLTLGMHNSF